jgi:hypothetical protein
MASCQWAVLTTESAYGVPTASPVLNADYLVLELLDDDPLGGMEPVPNNEQLYSWLACGEADRAIGETYSITGTIRTLLYPTQAALLLGWAFRPVDDQEVTGDEIPWVTAEPEGQMASMCLDFAYRDDAGDERKNRLLGGKVTGATLSADRGTRDGAFVLELETTWSSRTSTAAAAPAASAYPSAAPYFLSATQGNVVINGNTLDDDFDALTIAGEYEANARFDASTVVSRIRHHRRNYTLEVQKLLTFTPDLRALRDNRTVFAASVTLDFPGGTGQQTIGFTMPSARVSDDGWSRSLPIAGDRQETLNIMAQFDRTAGYHFATTIGTQA